MSELLKLTTLQLAQLFACAFFAILFLQSGFDKALDFKGNLEYLTSHFVKSPLRGKEPLLLGVMTVFELAAGLTSAAGAISVVFHGPHVIPVAGVSLACVSFLCLFTGQRIAKDYAGAATLAIYMGVALISLLILS